MSSHKKQKALKLRLRGILHHFLPRLYSRLLLMKSWSSLKKGKHSSNALAEKWYFARVRQRANHCTECKAPSRMPVRLLTEKGKKIRREATLSEFGIQCEKTAGYR